MKMLNEKLIDEGKAPAPVQIDPAQGVEAPAPMPHKKRSKIEREARVTGVMGELLAGAVFGADPALDKCKMLAVRMAETSGQLAEVGFGYVTMCAYKLTRDDADLFAELKKYDGKDVSTLGWRQSVMWHLELVETNGQTAKGDDKYKRTDECTQRVYSAFMVNLSRVAPIVLYAMTQWPDLKMEDHEPPFCIKSLRDGGTSYPRLAVPRALIEEDSTGTCILDGQEGRTLSAARATARNDLGFGEQREVQAGKIKGRNVKQETDTFKKTYKLLTEYFLNGMGEKSIRPFGKVPAHVRNFVLQVATLADACESPAIKTLPWTVKK